MVEYRTADGIELRGAWCRGNGATALVYFHGNAEAAGDNVGFGRELAANGYDVFLAEYRGYGGLSGEPSEQGLFLDAEAALSVVYAAGFPRAHVALVGRSLGTGIVIEMAQRGHGSQLVLISPYTSMVDVARSIVGPFAFLVADKFDSLAKIRDIRVPITVIHGTRDAVVPFELGKRLAQAAGAELVKQEGFGHNDLVDLPELIDRALRY